MRMLTREQILNALVRDLGALPWALALVEGGAAAWGRVDQWSDIDLGLLVEDGREQDTFHAVEACLSVLSPVEMRFEMPQPTLNGQPQAFFRLEDAGPFLLIDLSLMKPDREGIHIPREIHGDTRIHFDKQEQVRVGPLDASGREQLREQLERQLLTCRRRFRLFQCLVEKELARGNWIEAHSFYMGFTLRPLLEVLGLLHRPAHATFATRYIYYELPEELHPRLERLWFVGQLAELADRHREACAWFQDCLGLLDEQGVQLPPESGASR